MIPKHIPSYFCSLLLVSLLLPANVAIRAQTAASAPETLELPLLAVDHEHRPVDDLPIDQLRVKVGTAAPFGPLAMRKELEDPISVAILLDDSRDSWHDLGQIADDLSALAGISFLPADRVSIYALDCVMVRSRLNAQPTAETLKSGVADGLSQPNLHAGKSSSACGNTVHLWDNVAAVVAALSHAPGRRVLLLVSSGMDHGSKYDWQTVQQYAVDQSVAIFGLRDQRQADADNFTQQGLSTQHSAGTNVVATHTHATAPREAEQFELLCANAGGLTLSSTTLFRKDALADIFFLVRSRLILTIPRDAYPAGVSHSIKVSIPYRPYFLSATGASSPLVAGAQ